MVRLAQLPRRHVSNHTGPSTESTGRRPRSTKASRSEVLKRSRAARFQRRTSDVRWVRAKFNDEDERDALIAEKEDRAHDMSEHGAFSLFFLNVVASAKVFCHHLITINTVFGVMLTVAAIMAVYTQSEKDLGHHGKMDWVLLGFAVVLPLSATVRFAFQRREDALKAISEFKSNALHIYLAHANWDWDRDGDDAKQGRAGSDGDWLEHSDKVFAELSGIGDELFRFLTLPTSSQGRHRALRSGRREAAVTAEASYLMFDSILAIRMSRLSDLAETLKRAGMAATEASRIRQWERYMCRAVEKMRMIKMYRTPQALRSFAQLFTLLLPPFYASSYVDLAYRVNSLAIGIIFGIITSVALTALYESVQVLEDPFVAHLSLDGVDVQEELCVLHWRQLVNVRRAYFPRAPPVSCRGGAPDDGEALNPSSRSRVRVSVFQRDLPDQESAMDSTFHTYNRLAYMHHGESIGRSKLKNPKEEKRTVRQTSAPNMSCHSNASLASASTPIMVASSDVIGTLGGNHDDGATNHFTSVAFGPAESEKISVLEDEAAIDIGE